jgi:hypothetical protein
VVRGPEPWAFSRGGFPNAYVSGRDLGDEITYILRRRALSAYAGVMLDRPSVLLHPWATDDTTTTRQDARAGEEFGAVAQKPESKTQPAAPAPAAAAAVAASFSDLDFLSDPVTTARSDCRSRRSPVTRR